jgi:YD repeat-containing protein
MEARGMEAREWKQGDGSIASLWLTITYTYDSRNRLDLLTINDSKTFDYYQDGMIKSLKYPNAIGNSTFTYDDTNRLTSLSNAAGSGTNHYSYQYDGNSNIQSITANGQTRGRSEGTVLLLPINLFVW